MENGEHRVRFEASVSEPEEGGPAKLFVWVRRFEGDDELTGRYEVFADLDRLDQFIARSEKAGEDVSELHAARERFAACLAGRS